MKRKFLRISTSFIIFLLLLSFFGCGRKQEKTEIIEEETSVITYEEIASLPEASWQVSASFPDRRGNIDDTLAMNSILSFDGYADQGELYLCIDEGVDAFDLYINSFKCDGVFEKGKIYRIDYSKAAKNGRNNLQVSSIEPESNVHAVRVCVPYPTIIEGNPQEEGFRKESFDLISDIIESDIEYGFTSAQLALIRHGKLVYAKTWGNLNSYEPDGTRMKEPVKADNNTLYDLASVTKMFAANYAIQKLVDEKEISLDDKVLEYLGEDFYEDTLDFSYDFSDDIDLETQQAWKASISIRNLLKHEAGFPAAPRYFNIHVDAPSQEYIAKEGYNILYSGSRHSEETREATLQAIFETPLYYKPGSRSVYSDVDYMILCFIIEKVSGLDLDTYLKENFYEPMGLKRITFNPLDHGFDKDDCAATELNGNTRDGTIDFPGVRTCTLQGEVHDEMAWYSMNGVSGHAGLFSNAIDLAKLASVMLTGGYEQYRFFSRNVIDTFIAPSDVNRANSGLGWQRQGDDQRSWYFSSSSSPATFGHQGWTGTMAMIDPENDLVLVYLTNERNTPLTDKDVNANDFNGLYYTASTLGYVSQILYLGMDEENDITNQLTSLLASMCADAKRLIPEGVSEDHPAYLNYLSKQAVLEKWKAN